MNPSASLPDFSSVALLVVGDVMLDRYYLGPAHRISPEAPVQVINVADVEERPGGAANVGVNANSPGGRRGPVTERLQSLYFDVVHGRSAGHVKWLAAI